MHRSVEKMSYEGQRVMSAVIFALIWTAGMLWWFYPDPGVMHPALLAAGGVIIGAALVLDSRTALAQHRIAARRADRRNGAYAACAFRAP